MLAVLQRAPTAGHPLDNIDELAVLILALDVEVNPAGVTAVACPAGGAGAGEPVFGSDAQLRRGEACPIFFDILRHCAPTEVRVKASQVHSECGACEGLKRLRELLRVFGRGSSREP